MDSSHILSYFCKKVTGGLNAWKTRKLIIKNGKDLEMVWQERQDNPCHVATDRSGRRCHCLAWSSQRWNMDVGSHWRFEGLYWILRIALVCSRKSAGVRGCQICGEWAWPIDRELQDKPCQSRQGRHPDGMLQLHAGDWLDSHGLTTSLGRRDIFSLFRQNPFCLLRPEDIGTGECGSRLFSGRAGQGGRTG